MKTIEINNILRGVLIYNTDFAVLLYPENQSLPSKIKVNIFVNEYFYPKTKKIYKSNSSMLIGVINVFKVAYISLTDVDYIPAYKLIKGRWFIFSEGEGNINIVRCDANIW